LGVGGDQGRALWILSGKLNHIMEKNLSIPDVRVHGEQLRAKRCILSVLHKKKPHGTRELRNWLSQLALEGRADT
jgi:hypothetical protein